MSSTSDAHADKQRREDRQLRVALRLGADAGASQPGEGDLLGLVLDRVASDEALREAGDHRPRPVDVQSRVEPPDQHERAVPGIAQPGRTALANHLVGHHRVDTERQPELRRHERDRAGEALRSDADDLVVARVQSHWPSDDSSRLDAGRTREPVADDDDTLIALGPLLVRTELTSGREPHVERREVTRRHDRRKRATRRVSFRHPEHRDRVRHDRVERLSIRSHLFVVGVGESAVAVGLRGVAAVDADDAGTFRGHRLEHQGVHEAEGGGVGANPEGQDQHGNC
jgi:hypothetical protein